MDSELNIKDLKIKLENCHREKRIMKSKLQRRSIIPIITMMLIVISTLAYIQYFILKEESMTNVDLIIMASLIMAFIINLFYFLYKNIHIDKKNSTHKNKDVTVEFRRRIYV